MTISLKQTIAIGKDLGDLDGRFSQRLFVKSAMHYLQALQAARLSQNKLEEFIGRLEEASESINQLAGEAGWTICDEAASIIKGLSEHILAFESLESKKPLQSESNNGNSYQ